jgi:hypothetical protein
MLYEVHFLVEKTVIIEAADDIQAELEAAKKLPREERTCVRGVQYTDSNFDNQIPMKEFSEPDFEWWADHNLVDHKEGE